MSKVKLFPEILKSSYFRKDNEKIYLFVFGNFVKINFVLLIMNQDPKSTSFCNTKVIKFN